MDNQHLMDLLVLASIDADIIDIYKNIKWYAEELGSHNDWHLIMQLLSQSIDNVYGDGSFERYQKDGTLPSQQ